MSSNKAFNINCLKFPQTCYVTSFGWYEFSVGLQSIYSTLAKLSMNNGCVKDDGVVAVVCTLADSASMRALELINNHKITLAGWNIFQLLVDFKHVLEDLILSDNKIDNDGARTHH